MSKEYAIEVLRNIIRKYGGDDFSFKAIAEAALKSELEFRDFMDFLRACEAIGI